MKEKDKSKKIVLTFDYELSLGLDTGTAVNSIIKPTDYILDLFSKYNAKGLFFIDATYLLTLKKHNHKDLSVIEKQIGRLINLGNDIGFHIHPQWLDAVKIDDERWAFKSFDRYRLHSLDTGKLNTLFYEACELLLSIVKKYDINYKIRAFRAGGWCIQPFTDLKEAFLKNRIKFDFSVNPGLYSKTSSYGYYDFRKAPVNKSFWRFENDPCEADNNGSFFEIPVSTVKYRNIDLWINHYFYRRKEKEAGDGKSISLKKESMHFIKKILKLTDILSSRFIAGGLDGLHFRYFKKMVKKLNNKDFNFITYVCHPKKLSKSVKNNLEYLLKNYETIGINEIEKILKV